MTTAALDLAAARPLATPRPSAARLWTGRVLTALVALFLTFDIVVKFVDFPGKLEGARQLGWSPALFPLIGVIAAVCLVLYLVPRTAPIGALLWTGYLGGASATHLRVGNPLFSHVLFPIYVAALLWGALYLRDERVRAVLRAQR